MIQRVILFISLSVSVYQVLNDEGYIVGAEYGGCPTLIIATDTPFFDRS